MIDGAVDESDTDALPGCMAGRAGCSRRGLTFRALGSDFISSDSSSTTVLGTIMGKGGIAPRCMASKGSLCGLAGCGDDLRFVSGVDGPSARTPSRIDAGVLTSVDPTSPCESGEPKCTNDAAGRFVMVHLVDEVEEDDQNLLEG